MAGFVSSVLVSALVAGTVSAPVVPNWDNIRIEHAVEVVSVDRGLTYLETEDGNIWGMYDELDASRLYAVIFDTRGTSNIEDDRILTAVAMD